MIDASRFICPKCRDFKFGSSREPDGTWTRMCRGQRAVVDDGVVVIKSCAFSWPTADDWKYMHMVVCASGPDDTFYVPTEASLPILESTRLLKGPGLVAAPPEKAP